MSKDNSLVLVELQGILGDDGLEARLRSRTPSSPDAERLERVYMAVFGERINRTCGNCLYDAYILLKINAKKDMENLKERAVCGFQLKAGAILRIPDGKGGRTLYSNANLTDAVATKWLKGNPNTRHLFAKVPDSFDAELEAHMAGMMEASAESVALAAERTGEVVEAAQAAKTAKKGTKTAKTDKNKRK